MDRKLIWLGICVAVLVVSATAQTTVTTSGGTTNTVPVFTGTSTVGNSPISVSGGNVGIGTTSPAAILDINGGEGIPASSGNMNTGVILSKSSGGVAINLGVVDTGIIGTGYGWLSAAYVNSANTTENFSLQPNGGNVGIGTTTPQGPLHVKVGTNQDIVFIANDNNGDTGAPGIIAINDANNNYVPLGFYASTYFLGGGNVGIGTTNPGAALEVNGTGIKLTAGSGGSVTYADGTTQTTAWNGVLNGGDYAEDMRATGKKEKYEPGDVLVLAEGDDTDIQKSAESYSTLVAGIYATKPGVVGRREEVAKSANNVPMAMVGVVPTKVSAENGPIRKGDLLVTASLPGYAMKGTDRNRMLGAVLGKAMGSLDSGTGVIEVLVTLQ